MVFPKLKTVIFVHGCFWHRHEACKKSNLPRSQSSYWSAKLEKNVSRDLRSQKMLKAMGWKVIVIWECEARKPERLLARLTELETVPHISDHRPGE